MKRCLWAENNPLLKEYHDDEWGNPVHDDKIHFEYLFLEVMQGGLNWLTILKKREAFREAFSNFNYRKISKYTEKDIEKLLQNDKIIRSRKKIEAVIKNAKAFLKIQEEYGSFDEYIWAFTDGKIIKSIKIDGKSVVKNELSDKISKNLKEKGFSFLGSITIYSHLQAAGLINDHDSYCYKY